MIKPRHLLAAAFWLTSPLFAETLPVTPASPAVAVIPAKPLVPAVPVVPELPPVLTPYLQNPTDHGMTVCFAAQGAQEVSVEYGPDGSAAQKNLPAQGNLIANTPWTIWRVNLSSLQPGYGYQYQVSYRLADQVTKLPVYHFRTLNPQAACVRVAAFNDLHNREALLAGLMSHVKPADFEFSVLLGDCFADPNSNKGAYGVFQTLNAYINLLDGANKPIVLVRGNHELRGSFSHQLANLFDLPNLNISQKWVDDQWQYSLHAGPVYFLALDTGEDDDDHTDPKSYKNPNLWQIVRKNEASWLQQLLVGKPGQNVPWRVFLSHIPLYNSPWASVRARELWAPDLLAFKPDLMLAGHTHVWSKPQPLAKDAPWPVIIGGGPGTKGGEEATVMLLEADHQALKVRLLGVRDGRLLTEFTKDKHAAGPP